MPICRLSPCRVRRIRPNIYIWPPIYLVITDMAMPKTDGVELIAALTKDYADLPIVAMSGAPDSAQYLYLASYLSRDYRHGDAENRWRRAHRGADEGLCRFADCRHVGCAGFGPISISGLLSIS